MKQLKTWPDKKVLQVLPKTAIGKALQYSLNQWSKLTAYLEHGLISIDKNRAESAIKPFVKTGYFPTLASQRSAACCISLTLFEQLPHISATDIDTLSP